MGGPGSERKVSLASGAGVGEGAARSSARTSRRWMSPARISSCPRASRSPSTSSTAPSAKTARSSASSKRAASPTPAKAWLAANWRSTRSRRSAASWSAACRRPNSKSSRDGAKPTLPLPFVVKAPREGSSVGVYHRARRGEVASRRCSEARKFSRRAARRGVHRRARTDRRHRRRPARCRSSRSAPKKDFYNFENKYPFLNPNAAGADHFCPAPLSEPETKRVQETALAAHRALDLRSIPGSMFCSATLERRSCSKSIRSPA